MAKFQSITLYIYTGYIERPSEFTRPQFPRESGPVTFSWFFLGGTSHRFGAEQFFMTRSFFPKYASGEERMKKKKHTHTLEHWGMKVGIWYGRDGPEYH